MYLPCNLKFLAILKGFYSFKYMYIITVMNLQFGFAYQYGNQNIIYHVCLFLQTFIFSFFLFFCDYTNFNFYQKETIHTNVRFITKKKEMF